ncbi:hypothetical protein DFP72DRAFT_373695 [Ephemerocybe angulata]|uniref:Uncharacterized protein n=1 Tax=Ephemerocybe angulata TaxID=980116 RepID=A0A8H6HWK8_9AGAR|nr:hypothetical protein DFP72DRAFT_373695 [Tulosesus angulatus]
MHGTNPYAQAGWFNPQNPNTINNQTWGISAASGPSIFGALPYPSSQKSLPTILTFHYVCLNPDVMNCTITGPTSIPYLEVGTVAAAHGARTVFRRPDGQAMAAIEWGRSPIVEISSVLPRQPVSHWLRLSADRAHRAMSVNGKEFMWVARDNCFCLFAFGELTKGPLVRIFGAHGAITLEITTEAFHLGVLEAAIVAAVVFQSGRTLD